MMVLGSKQHTVTTKYKMQATLHFSLFCQSGKDIIIQKCRSSRFCCRTSSCGNNCWGLVIFTHKSFFQLYKSLTYTLTYWWPTTWHIDDLHPDILMAYTLTYWWPTPRHIDGLHPDILMAYTLTYWWPTPWHIDGLHPDILMTYTLTSLGQCQRLSRYTVIKGLCNRELCLIKRWLSNFCLQNKTAAAHRKCDYDDQQCRRWLSTLHFHKKKTKASNL